MPSNKPRLMTYTSETTIKKFAYISEQEKRSSSKQLEYIIEKYIEQFETTHGELIIEDNGTIHPKSNSKSMGKSSISKTG